MAVLEKRCAVEGCERSAFSRGWCRGHYDRYRRSGSAGPASFKPIQSASRPCREPGCGNAVGKAGARGWCYKHYVRWKVHGDPQKLGYHGNGLSGEQHPLWVGDDASYSLLHQRIARTRGLAASHACHECGGEAADWAYDHSDPDEKTDPKTGLAFSLDVSRYQPMCKSCHKLCDNAHRREGVI